MWSSRSWDGGIDNSYLSSMTRETLRLNREGESASRAAGPCGVSTVRTCRRGIGFGLHFGAWRAGPVPGLGSVEREIGFGLHFGLSDAGFRAARRARGFGFGSEICVRPARPAVPTFSCGSRGSLDIVLPFRTLVTLILEEIRLEDFFSTLTCRRVESRLESVQ